MPQYKGKRINNLKIDFVSLHIGLDVQSAIMFWLYENHYGG
jgi:hypothetical protein